MSKPGKAGEVWKGKCSDPCIPANAGMPGGHPWVSGVVGAAPKLTPQTERSITTSGLPPTLNSRMAHQAGVAGPPRPRECRQLPAMRGPCLLIL